MLVSHNNHANIGDLARTWTPFDAAAAEAHLRDMIDQMERSGDTTWRAIYRGILGQVSARAKGPWRAGGVRRSAMRMGVVTPPTREVPRAPLKWRV